MALRSCQCSGQAIGTSSCAGGHTKGAPLHAAMEAAFLLQVALLLAVFNIASESETQHWLRSQLGRVRVSGGLPESEPTSALLLATPCSRPVLRAVAAQRHVHNQARRRSQGLPVHRQVGAKGKTVCVPAGAGALSRSLQAQLSTCRLAHCRLPLVEELQSS